MNDHPDPQLDRAKAMFHEVERLNGGIDQMSEIIGKIQSFGGGMYEAFVSTMKIITFAVSAGQIEPPEGAEITNSLIKFILSPEAKARIAKQKAEILEMERNGSSPEEIRLLMTRELMKITSVLNIPEAVVVSATGVEDLATKEEDFIPKKKVH